MATASATISVSTTSIINSNSRTKKGHSNVKFIRGINGFNGLKAENNVTSLGGSVCCEQGFAKVISSLKKGGGRRSGGGGGAVSSTCNAAGEIFQIAAIMNGLTLVGVAVGFVLLRIEAAVEEAE